MHDFELNARYSKLHISCLPCVQELMQRHQGLQQGQPAGESALSALAPLLQQLHAAPTTAPPPQQPPALVQASSFPPALAFLAGTSLLRPSCATVRDIGPAATAHLTG